MKVQHLLPFWFVLLGVRLGNSDGLQIAAVKIISIGSVSRVSYQRIQKEAMAKHPQIEFVAHTEQTVPQCKLCKVWSGEHFGKAIKRERATKDWWCAQKRVLTALELELGNGQDIPSFVLVVDDDTFVNPKSLLSYTAHLDPKARIYTGEQATSNAFTSKLPFVNGGGGSLLSRSVLKDLVGSPIRDCVNRIQDGRWCDWHSDWTLAKCVHIQARTEVADASAGLFNQRGGVSACSSHAITCHGSLTSRDLAQLYQLYV